MISEFEDWFAGVVVPDKEFVVIASRAELLLIERPLQSADLLFVAGQLIDEWSVGAKIALQDCFVP